MDNHHQQSNDFFIPGLELISLTDEYDDNDSSDNCLDRDEPMVDWIEDCQVQENLFQIIPLTPEETICDKDNHIIKSNVNVFFEELGYICDEPEAIDPGCDYEAEYKQQQQKYDNNVRRRRQRQRHVDLETIITTPASSSTTTTTPAVIRHGTMDTVSSPGLSSTSSSLYHTDDDEDNIKPTTSHFSRLSHLNHHHYHHPHHHYQHSHHFQVSSVVSKPTTSSPHFSFTSVRF
ncbi:hypothetical protein BCR42DRAFT_417950 [Absidia repens]|uniref:Uncharacterized protein n=1 Tax=Absidia repens TaxID=90262 RepID=A0A1X2ICM2_9FUNG|nr:hypothetical protein BCR42DRAFT_417950 [Absidia repens]